MTAETSPSHKESQGLAGRLLGQGALLFGGFAIAQAFSFLRNAVLGHTLSRGDFGTAATITLTLQLLDILSDLGADRLIVQAKDGAGHRLMASLHGVSVLRGLLTSALLLCLAGPIATFFRIPDAWPAFAAAAVVPLAKAFIHLDYRRHQRALDNRAFLAVEAIPQIAAFLALIPALALTPGYSVVVTVAIVQALLAVAISHTLADRSYRLTFHREHLSRILAFGWPIWASAIPLIAVYQGDRALVGHMFGVEVLAGYSAAFMVTMVPGLIAAKVGNALMLPVLARAIDDADEMARRFRMMTEVTVIAAALYAVGFVVGGEALLPLAFGPNYHGLGALTGWLAVMWSIRMIQAVPGMALMAAGQNHAFLVAGIVRATGLGGAFAVAIAGYGIEMVAAAGVVAELASLAVMALSLAATRRDLIGGFTRRTVFLAPTLATAAITSAALVPMGGALIATAIAVLTLSLLIAAIGVVLMPGLRGAIISRAGRRTTTMTSVPAAS